MLILCLQNNKMAHFKNAALVTLAAKHMGALICLESNSGAFAA